MTRKKQANNLNRAVLNRNFPRQSRSLFGAFRRGNNPPVLLGEEKVL